MDESTGGENHEIKNVSNKEMEYLKTNKLSFDKANENELWPAKLSKA